MIGYAVREIFSKREQGLLERASAFVERVPAQFGSGEWVRCHELARAVGRILELEVCDGWYGFVDHSWLWTTPRERVGDHYLGPMPNILDVYVPGHLPQVQLVHTYGSLAVPYRPSHDRDDISVSAIEELIACMKENAR